MLSQTNKQNNVTINQNGDTARAVRYLPTPSMQYKDGSYKYLLVRFGELASDPNVTEPENVHYKEFNDVLYKLSSAVAYSVLKKCINVGGCTEKQATGDTRAELLRKYRAELTDALRDLGVIRRYNDAPPFETVINKSGKISSVCIDRDLQTAYDNACNSDLGSGIDLLQTAAVELLDERKHGLDAFGSVDLEREETRRVCRAHVIPWLGDDNEHSERAWKDVKITPIQSVYRAVRAYIQANRHETAAAAPYGYEETVITDPETGATAVGYKRTSKYSDLLGTVCNSLTDASEPFQHNAATINVPTVSGDASELDYIKHIIDDMKLTKQQLAILTKRLAGKSTESIISDLCADPSNTKARAVTAATIRRQGVRMREKAIKLFPEWERKYFTEETARAVMPEKKPVYVIPRLSTVTEDFTAWKNAQTVKELIYLFIALESLLKA